MKICLISVEIFAWEKYGGFGRSTRMIGRELVRHGVFISSLCSLDDFESFGRHDRIIFSFKTVLMVCATTRFENIHLRYAI